MELIYNRRLLLLNEDVPASTTTTTSRRSPLPQVLISPKTTTNSSLPSESESMASSSFLFGRPLILPARAALSSNVAYTILILLTALFLLGFISMYIRKFAIDSPAAVSSRRRLHVSSSNHYSTASAPCGGLDPTTVESLPVFAYNGNEKLELDCAVCLSELEEGEIVKLIPYCKHVFHPECIDTWLVSHVTCPICRCTKIFPVKRQGEEGVVVKAEENSDQGASNHQGRSAVENGDGWGQGREVGSHSERRTSTSTGGGGCSYLNDRVMLRRTMSY